MRVIVISDTHYQPRFHAVLEAHIDTITALRPDCVVHAGDVGERIDGFTAMLRLMERLPCPRLVLTGNHDVWADNGTSSEALWMDVLPRLTRDYGAIWLEAENWSQNGIGICGTNGWYDYSGRDPALKYTDDQYYRMMRKVAPIDWRWTDVEFATLLGEAFSRRLAALDADPTIREILVVTHVPPFEAAIIRRPWRNMGLRNAYSFNLTLGWRIVTSDKVKRVVSGHIHRGVTARVNGAAARFDVVEADYGSPGYVMIDYA
ncbi:MAG TPA: metallophosphoesterase [Aggregatilineales bacterium]|nr:metallophosphoesterase [Aggregatilineales bacterium]